MEVAKTILAQLGGNRFVAMTGAKNFVAQERGLFFKLPGGKCVRVTLNGRDLYDVEFLKWLPREYTFAAAKPAVPDVHVENLREVFTALTGLETHL